MPPAKKNPTAPKKRVRRYHDPVFLKKMGAHLKEVRTQKGYSIDRLYLEAQSLDRATISRLERGLIDPQLSTLKRYADTLGLKIWELLRYE